MTANSAEALSRMRLSAEGLAVGDAFGELAMGGFTRVEDFLARYDLPPGPWWYTDDTEQALGLGCILEQFGEVIQGPLVMEFSRRYERDPHRGYGNGAHRYFQTVQGGADWREVAPQLFPGGSKGNGSAMRIPPLGAYFADRELSHVVEQATRSAQVTHSHPEGIAGAVAVALAAAVAWQMREKSVAAASVAIFETALRLVPRGETWDRIETASRLLATLPVERAANILGNGSLVTCPDTVPFVLWSACRNIGNFQQALFDTFSAGGDRDTNCAMVCGIVALYTGLEGIPPVLLECREKLDWG